MDSLFLLIPIALVLVTIAFGIFLWAVKNGQFEDLDTESKRILFDDVADNRSHARAASDIASEPTKKLLESTTAIDNDKKRPKGI